jgi:putative transposase
LASHICDAHEMLLGTKLHLVGDAYMRPLPLTNRIPFPGGSMFFKKQRKPNRFRNYDYSASGIYFITICTAARAGNTYMRPLLGKIVDGKMILNQRGAIADKCWREIPLHFPAATLDAYVLMPNHIHGIISIEDNPDVPAAPLASVRSYPRTKMLIPKIVQQFKASVTRKIRADLGYYLFKWQRSYYDNIVRNGRALENIRQYILNNPIKWQNEAEEINNGGKTADDL